MSEYNELIKDFSKIRDYMRDFYVYGFKSREAFDKKSLRSYDNIKRRVESYLDDFIAFRQDQSGKAVYIEVDSSRITTNPLYRVFKAKSFTKNDITLHFILLDILADGKALSVDEIADRMTCDYLHMFNQPNIIDSATIRNKLNEYVDLGYFEKEKDGKKNNYRLSLNEKESSFHNLRVRVAKAQKAIQFFSETSFLGVIGSYILDTIQDQDSSPILYYKHHYILHALESEIVYDLLTAIQLKKRVEIHNHSSRKGKDVYLKIIPLKLLISVQNGRRYLSAYCYDAKAILNFRLDYIKSVKQLDQVEGFSDYVENLEEMLKNTWGASFGRGKNLEHLSMTIKIKAYEFFIIERLEREKRHGKVTKLSNRDYKFEIDVYDSMEMLPWIRTFIGKITEITCDNKVVIKRFYEDVDKVYNYYVEGGQDGNF